MSFAIRDYKVRYAQTYIGYWWSILQPLASVSVLYLIFQKMVNVPTEGISYLPFALSGLVLWNYFSYIITQSAASLINAQSMIRKIYFPKLCLPLSRVIVGLIEPGIGFLILMALLFLETDINWIALLFYPVAVLFTALAGLGIGLWASALSIRYRDIQQVLPFILQLLFFLTPIAYSSELVDKVLPESYRFLIYLNPISGIIESFRALIFGGDLSFFVLISFGVSILFFLSGLRYFQRVELKIADLV
jgi:lipopolysaccharide transport system permease protein